MLERDDLIYICLEDELRRLRAGHLAALHRLNEGETLALAKEAVRQADFLELALQTAIALEKEKEHARRLREDEGPVPPGGPEHEAGEDEGGEDLQQPEEAGAGSGDGALGQEAPSEERVGLDAPSVFFQKLDEMGDAVEMEEASGITDHMRGAPEPSPDEPVEVEGRGQPDSADRVEELWNEDRDDAWWRRKTWRTGR